VVRARERELPVTALGRRRVRVEDRELLGLAVEPDEGSLKHRRQPEVSVLIEFQIVGPDDRVRIRHRHVVQRDLAALGIELPEYGVAEGGIPGESLRIDDHVVRLVGSLGQVVFGVDNLGRLALRPWERLQLVRPRRP
jgi:hypothetical protein